MNGWLKCHYKEVAVCGPDCKRVKFSDILDEATTGLSSTISNIALARAIRDEFPNAVNKKAGDKRHTFVYGIEKDSTDPDIQSSLAEALRKNDCLEQQVQQLQQKLEHESALAKQLDDQMQSLLNPNLLAYHGPDSIEHLRGFSMDSIIEEFTMNAPDVMDLIQQLGNCSRHGDSDAGGDHLRIATLRSATALCTLLKCRSVKVLGLQLLIAFMLIARELSPGTWMLSERATGSGLTTT